MLFVSFIHCSIILIMTVTNDFSCKLHYTNIINCMPGTKTNRANPCRFARWNCIFFLLTAKSSERADA